MFNYFSRYNKTIVVFIEDMDRLNKKSLFIDLKDINRMLNEKLSNKVIFVYSLDSKIFLDGENRTKFFDVIIPVIPFTTYFNNDDIFDYVTLEIDQKVVSLCSKYIFNKRLSNSISNEFKIYKSVFLEKNTEYYNTTEKLNKIFIYVVFKNIFPTAYPKLFSKLDNFLDETINKIFKLPSSQSDTKTLLDDIVVNGNSELKDCFNGRTVSAFDIKDCIDSSTKKIVLFDTKTQPSNGNGDITSPDKSQNKILVDFIFQLFINGYMNLDFFEYLSPINFNSNSYPTKEAYNLDMEQRRMVMLNSSKADNNYVFKNSKEVISSLPIFSFKCDSILNYYLIYELYENNIIHNNKLMFFKEKYIGQSKKQIENDKFINLFTSFIENDRVKSDVYNQSFLMDVYSTFGEDTLSLLSSISENYIENTSYLIKFLVEGEYSYSLNYDKLDYEKISNNPELFYRNLTLETSVGIINHLKKELNFSVLDKDFNKKLLNANCYSKDSISLDNYIESTSLKEGIIKNLLNEILGFKFANYVAHIKSMIKLIEKSKDGKFVEDFSLITEICKIAPNVITTVFLKKLNIDDYKMLEIKNLNLIRAIFENCNVNFSLENLKKVYTLVGYNSEGYKKYFFKYYEEIINLYELEYIRWESFEYLLSYKENLEPSILKNILYDKSWFGRVNQINNQTTIKNLTRFAFAYDPNFEKINIEIVFSCQNFDEFKDENLEKLKLDFKQQKIDSENKSYEKYKKFIEFALVDDYEMNSNKNGMLTLKELQI